MVHHLYEDARAFAYEGLSDSASDRDWLAALREAGWVAPYDQGQEDVMITQITSRQGGQDQSNTGIQRSRQAAERVGNGGRDSLAS
jgi:hypothetical protein